MKIYSVIPFFIISVLLQSCNGQNASRSSCLHNFNKAKNIVFDGYTRVSALDSALKLVDLSISCDSIRKDAIELKVMIISQLKYYDKGIKFINSLKNTDFDYQFKRDYYLHLFEALSFASKGDSIKSKNAYKVIDSIFSIYSNSKKLTLTEFKQIFIYKYEVKRKYMTIYDINKELDSLKSIYPDRIEFFNLLAY